MTKAERIKNTLKVTKQRRETQDCKVYTCKFDFSHLSKQKREYLNRLFLEAKWLRNYIIARDDIFNETDKHAFVIVINKDREKEERELKCLSSQMKQGILDQIKNDISGLSASKEKGRKVGKLKFKSRVNSIGLKQFNNTYKIRGKSYITLQGFNKPFRVRGLKQIPVDAEIANAKLLRKPSGYYLAVTCYVPQIERVKTGKEIGFDFGIGTHITDTGGIKDNWDFQETKRHKRIQRKVNKTYKKGQKSSRNREYRRHLCRLEHERLSNRKKDTINKFVSNVKTNYDFVGVQDESIAAWKSSRMKGWGRTVHYSIMGGIISGIKQLPQTQVVDKWEPTTQECLICGEKTKHGLDQRTFVCSHCGHTEDRDTHSAKVVLKKAKQIHAGRMNTIPVESEASICQSAMIGRQASSMKQEAPCFSTG